ncbi:MAG: peptidyl-prolyl cis-trans isomerase [Alphaproteobacteria bacterium]
MLRALRKSAGTWVVRIFLLLLAALFGVGIWSDPGSLLRDRSTTTVATVADVELLPQEFGREYQAEASRARSLLGASFDTDPDAKMQVALAVVDRMAMRVQFGLEASRLGIGIGDDLMRRFIFANPAFHDETGAFSADIFAGRVAAQGLSESGFVALLRDDLSRRLLIDTIARTPAPSATLVNRLHAYRNEERVVDYVLVRSGDRPAPADPGEDALMAYYQEHAGLYTAPEYRAATAVAVDPTSLTDGISIAEEDALALYEERVDTFQVPERRTVDQIVLADQAAARAVADRLAQGEDFAAVAASVGQGAAAIALGTLARADFILPELADAAFGLAVGRSSAPVRSPLGWHVLRVSAIEPPSSVPFEAARPALEAELALDKATDLAYELINDLEDSLAAGASLEEAAVEVGLKAMKVPPVDAAGMGVDGARATLPEPRDRFLALVFETPAGSVAPLEETPQGGFFVARTDELVAPRQRDLAEVRDQVTADWRAAAQDQSAAEAVAQGAARLAAGETIEAVAAALGARVTRSAPFKRAAGPAGVPLAPDLVDRLFRAAVGEVTTAKADDDAGHLLVRLVEIRPVSLAAESQDLASLRAEIVDGVAEDLATAYRATLAERFPVEVNRGVLEPML